MDLQERKKQAEIKAKLEQEIKAQERRAKRKKDKVEKTIKFKKDLLEPKIKNNLIMWKDKNNDGKIYEGRYKKKLYFIINRGLMTFTLKIVNDKIKSDRKMMISTKLFYLQEKANAILHNNAQFLNN